jgi:hypothetical protein
MSAAISAHFAATHQQLDVALRACLGEPGQVDVKAFDDFRHRLLRHIAQEEKVLFPALIKKLGNPPLFRNALRKDHAGLAALCVPLPEREWVENLSELFEHHSAIEEAAGGFYALCDEVLGADAAEVIAAAEALPPLVLAPFNRGPWVRALLGEVLRATGIEAAPD